MTSRVARVKVPATIGNVGPGFDVLGLCIDQVFDTMTASLTLGPSQVRKIEGRDAERLSKNPTTNCAIIAAESYLRSRGDLRGIDLSIERDIPLSGGLGSSAAASLGGALLAAACRKDRAEDHAILTAALDGEAAVAGRHLDNIAPCYYGGLTLCVDSTLLSVKRISPAANWWVALVTPSQDLPTKESRALLPPSLATWAWTQQMARTTAVALAFAEGDVTLLKSGLKDGFAEVYRSPLIADFEVIKRAAMNSGAIGCSISGGGPSIFAICESESQARACMESMKRQMSKPPRFFIAAPIRKEGAILL